MAGAVTLLLLLASGLLLLAGREAWRPLFALAHLGALVALTPLGVVLVVRAFREARAAGGPGLGGVVRRHPGVAAVLAVILAAVVVSLLNFDDGARWLRRVANLTTVTLVVALVARYLTWVRRGPGPR